MVGVDMYKDRVLVRFRRYFLHAIREGKCAEDAAGEAMWKTREETLAEIERDPQFKNKIEKELAWGAAFEVVSMLRMCFVDYDTVYEERKRQSDQIKTIKEQAPAVRESGDLTEAVVAGIEHRASSKEKEDTKKEGSC